MKLVFPTALLVGSSYAQFAAFMSDMSMVGWTESSPDGSKDEATGTVVQSMSDVNMFSDILTAAEKAAEQAEIVEYRKKYEGIYDPNMYPYGPLHSDVRVPNADDAVSDPISLPSDFPLFNGASTGTIRATSNGLVILDNSAVLDASPQDFSNNDIDANFVAGYWNDIWSKKHGRIYMRVEQTNTTMLEGMRQDIIAGFEEFGDLPGDGLLGDLKYAFVYSLWRVTHFGAVTGEDQKQNTFQMVLTTDGTHSFLINNYQLLQWNKAVGQTEFASAGYDIEGFNSGAFPVGSGTSDVLNLAVTNTSAAITGRHVFQLDNNPIAPNSHPCDTNNGGCNNGATCVVAGVTFTCSCAAGFKGATCDDVDVCGAANGGCQNGATCADNGGVADCTCAAGFLGSDCSVTDPCDNASSCKNGASCTSQADGSFTCACAAGFQGADCGTPINNACDDNANLCNGGTCTDNGNGGYSCSGCPAGFAGANCEIDTTTLMDADTNEFTNTWPENDNCGDSNPQGCLGGAIGHYRPGNAIGNGTCVITFPSNVAYFHIFDAHIRTDSIQSSNAWAVCAANPGFEPGEDQTFSYMILFDNGADFSETDVAWNCSSADEYTYAVYSFPQNFVQADGRSNIRKIGNNFDNIVTVSLGAAVANFTVDDPRITVTSADNQNFVLSDADQTNADEIWFQFDYLPGNFFLSNTVGVNGN